MTPEEAAQKFIATANKVPSLIEKKMHRAVLTVERKAKQVAPVRTGTLRRDIRGRVEAAGRRGAIGNSPVAPYAIYVHEGTRRMKARPYLRDGLVASRDTVMQMLSEINDEIARGVA